MNEVEKLKYKNITHAFMIKNNNYKICKYKSIIFRYYIYCKYSYVIKFFHIINSDCWSQFVYVKILFYNIFYMYCLFYIIVYYGFTIWIKY